MEIVVNGYVWRVVFTDDRRMLEREDGVVTLGVTDRSRMCIFLYSGLYGEMLRKVLVHELCHAYVFSYGYVIPPEYEEVMCGFIHSHWESIADTAYALAEQAEERNIIKL